MIVIPRTACAWLRRGQRDVFMLENSLERLSGVKQTAPRQYLRSTYLGETSREELWHFSTLQRNMEKETEVISPEISGDREMMSHPPQRARVKNTRILNRFTRQCLRGIGIPDCKIADSRLEDHQNLKASCRKTTPGTLIESVIPSTMYCCPLMRCGSMASSGDADIMERLTDVHYVQIQLCMRHSRTM